MNNFEKACKIVLHIIKTTYPISPNGKAYLRITTGEKIFFDMFLKKYGILGNKTKYNAQDVMRRIRHFESLPYLFLNYLSQEDQTDRLIIKTHFFTIVILKIQTKKDTAMRYELLSFYHHF